ncbi:MAG: PilZ domain-containing protein [Myxococcales bacterium]|nr:PilZ domain-containing protein [Myxococcales bacterium]
MSGHGHFRGLWRRPARLAGALGGADGLWRRPATIVDLSLGGARVHTDAEIPAGSVVRLEVESPNRWDPLEVSARVAWTNVREGGTEMGLAFEVSSSVIRGLVDLLAADGYG